MFELHWNRFPDDSMTPNWLWHQVDWTKPYADGSSMYVDEWADLTQGISLYPKLPDYFKDKDILGYCPIHKELYYLHGSNPINSKGQCFHCWLHETHPSKTDTMAETVKQIEEDNKTFRYLSHLCISTFKKGGLDVGQVYYQS